MTIDVGSMGLLLEMGLCTDGRWLVFKWKVKNTQSSDSALDSNRVGLALGIGLIWGRAFRVDCG